METKSNIPKVIMDIDLPNKAEVDYQFSIWFGAIIFYLLSFGRKPFRDLFIRKYKTRNVIVGWLMRIVIVFGVVYFVVR